MAKRALETNRRWEAIGLCIAIAGAIGVAATGYRTTQALATTAAEVDRTHRTIEALDEVINSVGAAGNARRSYLFGDEGIELQRFAAASDAARDALAQARALASEDTHLSSRLDRVDALLVQRLASLDDSVARHQRGLGGSDEPPLRSETELMARLRTAITDATSEPRRLLVEREAKASRSAVVAQRVELFGTALALAILVLAFTSLRRHAERERVAHEATARATRFLDSVVDHLPAMVFLKEAKGLSFERINRAGEELLGVSREALLGKSDRDFFPAEQARFFEEKDRQALAKGEVVDVGEEPIQTKTGLRWLHTRKVPLLDAKGDPAYLLGISEDITERKANAEALESAKEKAEAVGRELESFSYSVAHDLRAPLRSIDGFTRALMEDNGTQLDDVGRGHLLRVVSAAHRMAELIDDLLTLSRISRTRLEVQEVDVSAIAAASAASLRPPPSEERQVHVQIAPALKSRADPHLVRILFDNLLDNAFKFTSRRAEATIEIGTSFDDGKVAFFVRDDGAGFDDQYAHKLFGAFQRLHDARDFPGTGIGLATVKRIVTRHGGRIWAKGEPERGATFFFTLAGDAFSTRPPPSPAESTAHQR